MTEKRYLWRGCIRICDSNTSHPLTDVDWLIEHMSQNVEYTIDYWRSDSANSSIKPLKNCLFILNRIIFRDDLIDAFVSLKGSDLTDHSLLVLRYGEDDRAKHWFRLI